MNKFKQFLTEATDSSNFNRAFGGLRSILADKASLPDIVKFCGQNFEFNERFEEQVLPYIESYGLDCGDHPYRADSDEEYAWQFHLCKWPNLRYLSLTDIGDRTLEALGMMRRKFPRVDMIKIQEAPVTDEGVKNLFGAGNWNDLDTLYLERTNITDESLSILSSPSGPSRLTGLGLEATDVTDAGVGYLCSNPKFCNNLDSLDLSFTKVGDETARMLARMSDTLKLEYLHLEYTALTDEGARMLSEGEWRKLKVLGVEGCDLSADGIGYLEDNLMQPFAGLRGPVEIIA